MDDKIRWISRRGPKWGREGEGRVEGWWEDEGILLVTGGDEVVAIEIRGGRQAGKVQLKQVREGGERGSWQREERSRMTN